MDFLQCELHKRGVKWEKHFLGEIIENYVTGIKLVMAHRDMKMVNFQIEFD